MLIIEALGALQFLKKELISLSDISNILGIGRAAMSARVQRKSILKPDEIEKINNYYDVDLTTFVEKNTAPQNTSTDKTEIIKIVEDYLEQRAKKDNGLSR